MIRKRLTCYCGHIGFIIKDEIEVKKLDEVGLNRLSYATLLQHLTDLLKNLENRTKLFEDLLCSYPERIKTIIAANGRHPD